MMNTGTDIRTNPGLADVLAALAAESKPSAGVLEELQCGRFSDTGALDRFLASEKLVRCAEAYRARALGDLHTRGLTDPFGSLAAEVQCVAHWAPSTTSIRLHQAGALTRLFPETLDTLQAGEISWEQAKALVDLTQTLDDDTARRVQDRVLPLMPRQTVADTRTSLRHHIDKLNPAAAKRHKQLVAERSVKCWAEPDGMATLAAYLPAPTAQAIMDTLTAKARRRLKGDKRTLDQRRADALARILLSGTCGEAKAPVVPAVANVVVPLSTLMGRCEEPAELKGYGPIGAQQARVLAFAKDTRWRMLIVDDHGVLLGATANTYRPPAAIRKLIQLRRPTCSFPGCNMPAERCDLDHRTSWRTGGCTGQCNLDPVCRRHHNLKTHAGWERELDPDTGTLTWTTPTGRTHTRDPHHYPTGLPDQNENGGRGGDYRRRLKRKQKP